VQTTSPQGVITQNTYDADGNLLTSSWDWTDPSGDQETIETVNSYDGNGNLTETDTYDLLPGQTYQDATPVSTTSSLYDADNRVYSSTDDLGGVTTTVYDANGKAIQTTTPDGMVMDSVYDDQGRAIYTDDPRLPGEPTNGTHTSYDDDGNVTGTETLANVVITVTKTGVDVGKSVLTSVGAILSTTSTTYDPAGRVTKTVDASGMETDNTYDAVGNLTSSTEIVNGVCRSTSSIYNALGQVTSTTDPLGNTTEYQYNSSGQVTKTTYQDGSSVTDVYDSQGNMISQTDQNDIETQYVYNAYNELTEVIEPSVTNPTTHESVNPTYTYAYDIYGNQISMTDAEGNTTTYTYNYNGNMISETLPMGGPNGTEYWDYNGLGQETEFIDFDGNETDYAYYGTGSTYGAPGQLETKTVYAYNNLSTPYETVTYEYNQNYNTTSGSYQDIVNDSLYSTPTTSTYDVNGNLVQITSPQGTINYTYDPATGEEIEVSSPYPVSGTDTDTHYSYDQAGELISVTVTSLDDQTLATPLVTSYTYDLDGNLIQTQNANGTSEKRTYNDVNELTSIVDSGQFGVYASFAYTYDAAGHVKTETDLGGRSDQYTYDSLYRLTEQAITDPSQGNSTYVYTYALDGNRFQETDTTPSGSQTESYAYNANGELTSLAGTSGYGQTYTYDANGSNLTVTGSGGASSATYTWDPQGRMIGATTGGNTVSYQYNDSDDRISETVNGQTTTFLNDPNQAYDQVLEEYAPSGVLAATYIRGIDLLFEDQSGALSYYATDNLGSTRALTNSAGAVTDTYSYDAYGNLIGGTQVTTNEFRFTGEQFDAAIGQYYLRARDYNPSSGAFISLDSIDGQLADPITENRYEYAGSDPTNFADPSGHFALALSLSLDLNFSVAFGAGLQLTAAGVAFGVLAYSLANGAAQNLLQEVTTLIALGESEAISLYNVLTSNAEALSNAVTKAVNEAVSAGKGLASKLSRLPMYPVVQSWTPAIYTFDTGLLASYPQWFVLTYNGPYSPRTDFNRRVVWANYGYKMATAPVGSQLDEFPYASTRQGGSGAEGTPVDWTENAKQGGLLGAIYARSLRGRAGAKFLVVPLPL
jgi:RHS repeat-associated protein